MQDCQFLFLYIYNKLAIFFMKTLKNYIQERLVINKDYKDTDSYFLSKCKENWDNIFDNIYELKTGNIRLGKIKLKDNNIKQNSSYKNSVFTLYVKTPNENEMIIRRTIDGRPSKWIVLNKRDFRDIDELFDAFTEKIKKLLSKEGYTI